MDRGDSTPTSQPSPSLLPEIGAGEKEVVLTSWAILILISLLLSTLIVSYLLEQRRVRRIFLHESIVAIGMGAFVGLVVRLYGGAELTQMLSFDHRYFFNLLLPPIILNSGYDLKPKSFFRNFGSILTFAFLGTLIASFVIGILLYLVSCLRLTIPLTFLDCMIFGSVLSSTDPVTIIAIFNQLKVDPDLFAIVFGESVLNDAVAIVLFTTLTKFHGEATSFASILAGTASFVTVFCGSLLIGTLIALITALILKHSHLHKHPALESCIITLLAYSSYLLSNSIHLSGIVSLLFTSIVMKHYCYDNMSVRTRRTTKYMFRVLSQLSENFVFIYLGITLFAKAGLVFSPGLTFFTIIIVLISRYASTIPVSQLLNRLNPQPASLGPLIPSNHAWILWWAGLRGAIAFALSFEMDATTTAPAIRTTTLIVCVVSIVGLGGTVGLAIEELGVRTGCVDEDDDASSGEEEEDWDDDIALGHHRGRRSDSDVLHTRAVSEDAMRGGGFDLRRKGPLRPVPASVDSESDDDTAGRTAGPKPSVADDHWFIGFDNRWIKPVFTRTRMHGVRVVPYTNHGSSPSRIGLLESGKLRIERGNAFTSMGSTSVPPPPRVTLQNPGQSASSSSLLSPQTSPKSSIRVTRSPTRRVGLGRSKAVSEPPGASVSGNVSSSASGAWKNFAGPHTSADDVEEYLDANGKIWTRGGGHPTGDSN